MRIMSVYIQDLECEDASSADNKTVQISFYKVSLGYILLQTFRFGTQTTGETCIQVVFNIPAHNHNVQRLHCSVQQLLRTFLHLTQWDWHASSIRSRPAILRDVTESQNNLFPSTWSKNYGGYRQNLSTAWWRGSRKQRLNCEKGCESCSVQVLRISLHLSDAVSQSCRVFRSKAGWDLRKKPAR